MKIFTKKRLLISYLIILFAAGWGGTLTLGVVNKFYNGYRNYMAQRENEARIEKMERDREREEADRSQQQVTSTQEPVQPAVQPQVNERELERRREQENIEKIQTEIKTLEQKNQKLISDVQQLNNNLEFLGGQPVNVDDIHQPACYTEQACAEIQRRIEIQISNNEKSVTDAKSRIDSVKNKTAEADGLKIKTTELTGLVNTNTELVKKIYELQPVAKKSYEDAVAAGRDVSFVTAVFQGVNAQELGNPDTCARSATCYERAKSAFAEAIATNEKIISNAESMIKKLNEGASK